jgi:hypothetical protein
MTLGRRTGASGHVGCCGGATMAGVDSTALRASGRRGWCRVSGHRRGCLAPHTSSRYTVNTGDCPTAASGHVAYSIRFEVEDGAIAPAASVDAQFAGVRPAARPAPADASSTRWLVSCVVGLVDADAYEVRSLSWRDGQLSLALEHRGRQLQAAPRAGTPGLRVGMDRLGIDLALRPCEHIDVGAAALTCADGVDGEASVRTPRDLRVVRAEPAPDREYTDVEQDTTTRRWTHDSATPLAVSIGGRGTVSDDIECCESAGGSP